MKTHQAIAKRFKITKKKKVLHRCCGQDHFNARETGNKKRDKRNDRSISAVHHKFISQMSAK